MKNKIAIFGALAFFAWSNRHTPLLQSSPFEISICTVLLLVCLYPTVRWLRRPVKPLPIFELFCMSHVIYYLQPYIDGKQSLYAFPEGVRELAGMATIGFLSAAVCVYTLRDRVGATPGASSRFMHRYVPVEREKWFWVGLVLWLCYTVSLAFGVFPNVGPLTNVVTTLTTATGTLGTYYLFYAIGERRLSTGVATTAALLLSIGILVAFTSGYLVVGALFIAVAIAAFTIGSKRLPIVATAICFAVVNFLHVGKADMRLRFWGTGAAGATVNPVAIYEFWVAASWNRMFDDSAAPEMERASVIGRASLIQMLAIVVEQTPDKLPYLAGRTFTDIPILLVPRIFAPDKPGGNEPSEIMAVYYGVQTQDDIAHTSVGLGKIAEAWANFGWAGIFLLGAFYGWLFSVPMGLTKVLAPNTIGYLLSAVALGWGTDLEHGLGTFLVSLIQAMVLTAILLYFMSKPARSARVAYAPRLVIPG